MNESDRRTRILVDRMLREAAQAERYLAKGKGVFFDIRSPEIRDAIELRLLHFTETAMRLGPSFRRANPRLPWDELGRLRNDLVHEYSEVKADRVWRFMKTDLPRLVRHVRHAKFPPEAD